MSRAFCETYNGASECESVLVDIIKQRITNIDTDSPTLVEQIMHTVTPPRFDVGSPEAPIFLENNGFVVYKSVAQPSELETAWFLLWGQFLAPFGASAADVSSWDVLPVNQWGIILNHGIGQSAFMWYIRTLPGVLRVFEILWGVRWEELLVDFAGCVIFRPTSYNKRWRTEEGWFHVDQNARQRPGRQTYQSFVALTDNNVTTGGLVVLPGSWRNHSEVCEWELRKQREDDERERHFVKLTADNPVFAHASPQLVQCLAGDLVVWYVLAMVSSTNQL
jgi:hypothetical protein